MASPQVENGYTKIANELLEEIYTLDINIGAMKVLLFILRKTYGWGKKRDKISLSQFKKALNKEQPHICRDIKKLITMKILIKIQNDDGSEYEINKNYDEWEVVPKQAHARIGNDSLPELVITPVPKQAHTKETITKETITKEMVSVLKNSKGEDIGSMLASDYQPDGWSPKVLMDMKRRAARLLGIRKSNTWSQLLFGSAWDFKKAYTKFQGIDYVGTIFVDEMAKVLVTWYEAGETRETIIGLIDAYFQSEKAERLAITPNACFSEHTYNSWKQGKLSKVKGSHIDIDKLVSKKICG